MFSFHGVKGQSLQQHIHTIYRLSLWIIDSLKHWFIASLLHWFTDSLIRWLTHSLSDSLVHCFVPSCIHWFIDSLVHWFIDSSIQWFIGSFSQLYMDSFMSSHWHLNNHLLIRCYTWQLQHFVASASQKLSYSQSSSYSGFKCRNFRPGTCRPLPGNDKMIWTDVYWQQSKWEWWIYHQMIYQM